MTSFTNFLSKKIKKIFKYDAKEKAELQALITCDELERSDCLNVRSDRNPTDSNFDFEIGGIKATSLFSVFEDRLTKVRINEDEKVLRSGTFSKRRTRSQIEPRSTDAPVRREYRGRSVFVTDVESSSIRHKRGSQDVSELKRLWKTKLKNQITNYTAFSRKEYPLQEEMDKDCMRIINSAEKYVLLLLLLNPEVDHFYPNFTEDFLITFFFHTKEAELFRFFFGQFCEWTDRLLGCCPSSNMFNSSEDSAGRIYVIHESHAPMVILRIVELLNTVLENYSYFDHSSLIDHGSDEEIMEAINTLFEVIDFANTVVKTHTLAKVRSWSAPLKKSSMNRLRALYNAFPEKFKYKNIAAILNLKERRTTSSYPDDNVTVNKRTKVGVLQLDPNELVRQLTILELELFKLITPLDLHLKSKDKLDKSKHLKEVIERFNKVSYWVATEICVCGSLRTRTNVLKLFITVAYNCFEWNNFNTCLQIVAALSMTCVQRLKNTWKALPKKHLMMWRELSVSFSSEKNYSAYRRLLLSKIEDETCSTVNSRKITGGIPFMGVWISDVFFTEEACGKTILENGTVNFSKMRSFSSIFKKLKYLQKITEYPFKVEPFTRRFLNYDMLILDEDRLWRASRICEPPEGSFMAGISTIAKEIPVINANVKTEDEPPADIVKSSPNEKGSQTVERDYIYCASGILFRREQLVTIFRKNLIGKALVSTRRIYSESLLIR